MRFPIVPNNLTNRRRENQYIVAPRNECWRQLLGTLLALRDIDIVKRSLVFNGLSAGLPRPRLLALQFQEPGKCVQGLLENLRICNCLIRKSVPIFEIRRGV
ncbi:hypothetical protein RUND412_007998 [Rhizina undulata]